MTQRKTVREIVELVANTYTSQNRSTNSNGDSCRYIGVNGNNCAFGMMVKDVEVLHLHEGSIASELIHKLGKDIIKDEFAGYPLHFYDAIQKLHDTRENWNTTGLTDAGEFRAESIIENYSDEDEHQKFNPQISL